MNKAHAPKSSRTAHEYYWEYSIKLFRAAECFIYIAQLSISLLHQPINEA